MVWWEPAPLQSVAGIGRHLPARSEANRTGITWTRQRSRAVTTARIHG